MKALTRARKRAHLSFYGLSRETGLSEQSIRNLEGIGATRPTLPCRVTAETMLILLERFPELRIKDFAPWSKLEVRRGR